MKIILATSNKHKVLELKEILKDFEIYAFDEVLMPFEIEENGKTFKENALIKARAVFNALDEKQKKDFIALSDDSGICVDVLEGNQEFILLDLVVKVMIKVTVINLSMK